MDCAIGVDITRSGSYINRSDKSPEEGYVRIIIIIIIIFHAFQMILRRKNTNFILSVS